ncbi:MAG: DNA polymerase III subunit delta' [Proteobacteria bacterium]|nr:DNA polymerase III subunit delta' [Pseudomonadota bacterium]
MELELPTPRQNTELLGQEAAESEFLDCYRAGRLPHAWILGGPYGIGKATLAFRIARFMFTHGGAVGGEAGLFGDALPIEVADTLAVDESDPVFRRVAAAGHSDLLTVERGYDETRKRHRAEITVDEARGVAKFLSTTSGEGGWRVVIVDGAETMNKNAANAILKILEEPPRQTLMLLVSHNPGRILPTIRSRCRMLRMPLLSDQNIATLLSRYVPDLAPEDHEGVIRIAEGSVGRALSFVEGSGVEVYRDMMRLLAGLPAMDAGALHDLSSKIGRDNTGELFRTARDMLSWWLARSLRAATTDPGSLPGAAGGLDRWFEVWEKIHNLFQRAESANLDHKQLILNAFLLIEGAARA